MATKITKWTRERGSQKDFVDPTRRTHQPLPHHLTAHGTAKLRELAKREEDVRRGRKREKEEESREDAVVRRRIEWLRAQLHDVTLGEQKNFVRGSLDSKASSREDGVAKLDGKEEVEKLKGEAERRKEILARVRTYIPIPPSPVTPKERGEKIHAKVLEVRREQVKEREEQRLQKRLEEVEWSRRALLNQEAAEEQHWRQQEEQREKRERLRRDLDRLCVEREKTRADEAAEMEREKGDLHHSHQVYHTYHSHLDRQAAIAKKKRREELELEIVKVREARAREEEREEAKREEELRYSEVKREFARRVKQSTLDKMKGKRSRYLPASHTGSTTTPAASVKARSAAVSPAVTPTAVSTPPPAKPCVGFAA